MLSKIAEIRREATFTITNLMTISDNINIHKHVAEFKNFEIIKTFAQNLKINDVSIIMEIIAALEVLIKLDKMLPEYSGDNSISYKFELAGGLD